MENLSRRSFVGGAVAAGIAAGTVAASAAVADETAQQAPAEIGKHTWEVAPDPITDIAQIRLRRRGGGRRHGPMSLT